MPNGVPVAALGTPIRHSKPPICATCRDAGWVEAIGPDTYRSQLVRCPACGGNARAQYLDKICGLPELLRGFTWTQKKDGRLAECHRAAARLIADPRWFFTLTGPYGSGKSGTLAAIVNAGKAAGKTAIYTTTADMLDVLRAAFAPGAPGDSYLERLDLFRAADILALDELDRFNTTPWAEQAFFQVMESRYENGPRMLTAFATNAKVSDLPGYLVSRMQDARCQVWELPAGDHRQPRKERAQ